MKRYVCRHALFFYENMIVLKFVLLPLYVQTVHSEESLGELVYEQWLYADLKDVVSQGCIPVCIARQQKGEIRGRFVVQVKAL